MSPRPICAMSVTPGRLATTEADEPRSSVGPAPESATIRRWPGATARPKSGDWKLVLTVVQVGLSAAAMLVDKASTATPMTPSARQRRKQGNINTPFSCSGGAGVWGRLQFHNERQHYVKPRGCAPNGS